MLWLETIKDGIQSLLNHKLRSGLSILGVVFGVAAVIAMLSIGEGARLEALEQIRLMGTNNIIIRDLPLSEEERLEAGKNLSAGLTLRDAQRIKEVADTVNGFYALRENLSLVRYLDRETNARMVFGTPDYLFLAGINLAGGRFLSSSDLEKRNRVAVLGHTAGRTLFPHGDGLGKTVEIQGQLFRVVGVLENRDRPKKKNLVVQVRDINQDVYVPLSLDVAGVSEGDRVDEIMVRVRDSEQVLRTAAIAETILKRIHNNVKDYEIIIPQELLRQSQKTQRIFNIVMGSIAGISLLVGGIGIMNIMLAVITERTREIGIRRAMGANRGDIIRQFLVETMVLTITGGIIGVVIGISGAKTINFYVDWRTVVSFESVFIAFFVSALIGILFGMYPAYKAANMNPIDALRYE